jgi:hypothetical protein
MPWATSRTDWPPSSGHERCGLRLVSCPGVLGSQSQVEWNGKRCAIDGEPRQYNGSRRTTHVDYIWDPRL